jgi:hypothetical protein
LSCRNSFGSFAIFTAIRSASSCAATALTTQQQLRQLCHVGRDPPRLVAREQLGRHASLIFGAWLICTIQVYARHGPQALLRPAADGDGARIPVSLAPHVVVEREKGWSDDPDAAPLP